MTWLQAILAWVGTALIAGAASALAFTVYRLRRGEPTLSGYLKHADRFLVATIGFVVGFLVGMLFAHWWFPTVGG